MNEESFHKSLNDIASWIIRRREEIKNNGGKIPENSPMMKEWDQIGN
jgi:hypothetical protein